MINDSLKIFISLRKLGCYIHFTVHCGNGVVLGCKVTTAFSSASAELCVANRPCRVDGHEAKASKVRQARVKTDGTVGKIPIPFSFLYFLVR
jgi:hypothetical protein